MSEIVILIDETINNMNGIEAVDWFLKINYSKESIYKDDVRKDRVVINSNGNEYHVRELEHDENKSHCSTTFKVSHVGFNRLLKLKRREFKLSLDKAAKKIGVTKPHLHDMENGKSNNPTAKVINGLIKVYDLTADEILTSISNMPKAA